MTQVKLGNLTVDQLYDQLVVPQPLLRQRLANRPTFEATWIPSPRGYDVRIPSLPGANPRPGDIANVRANDGRITPVTVLQIIKTRRGIATCFVCRGHADADRRALLVAAMNRARDAELVIRIAMVGCAESADWQMDHATTANHTEDR
jgi:hypothetical protein